MSRTVLTDIKGWSPTINSVIKDLGLIPAVVFGRVWSYCQMESGVCYASQSRMADEIGLERKAFNRHLATLVENGYIKDLTPDLIGKAHTYADTGKAGLRFDLTASMFDSDSQPVPKSPRSDETCTKKSQVPVPKSPTNILNNKLNTGADAPASEPEKKEKIKKEVIPLQEGEPEVMLTYPSDVREVLSSFFQLWEVPIPEKPAGGRGEYAQWIKELREVKKIMGDYGLRALEMTYASWFKHTFTVSHPGAIIKTLRSCVGILNQQNRPARSVPKYTPVSTAADCQSEPEISTEPTQAYLNAKAAYEQRMKLSGLEEKKQPLIYEQRREILRKQAEMANA
jgi:hypothetical protein